MKILMINGSPHSNSCTYTALHDMKRVFHAADAQKELLTRGADDVRGHKRVDRKPFSYKRGEFTIRGFAYQCAANNRVPVIMSHAFLFNQRIMRKYAEALAQEGYVVFTYDFCGGASFGKSDGAFRDMSIDTEKDDLKAVIAYVETLREVDINRLVLLGASQGGFVSCLVAAEYQERISKLILLYPALCIPDDARAGNMLMIRFDPDNIRGTLTSRPFKFSPEYPESAIGINIYEELQKIKIPILLLHGTADRIVDIGYARRAEAVFANSESRLIVVSKAGHGFNRAQARDAIGHMISFLAETGLPDREKRR